MTYRKTARKEFLNVSKSKRKTSKMMRQGIIKQIAYIERNLSNIAKTQATCGEQTARHSAELETIKAIVAQQKHMFKNKTQSVENRIVNISQPHVRPIPRGKTNAMTEFGAKVEISIIDGFARIETLKFDAYNEGGNLQEIIEKYKKKKRLLPSASAG